MNKPKLKKTEAVIMKLAHKPLEASSTELSMIMCLSLARLEE